MDLVLQIFQYSISVIHLSMHRNSSQLNHKPSSKKLKICSRAQPPSQPLKNIFAKNDNSQRDIKMIDLQGYHIVGRQCLRNLVKKHNQCNPKKIETPTSVSKKIIRVNKDINPVLKKSDLLSQHYQKENAKLHENSHHLSLKASRVKKMSTTLHSASKTKTAMVRAVSMHKQYQSLWEEAQAKKKNNRILKQSNFTKSDHRNFDQNIVTQQMQQMKAKEQRYRLREINAYNSKFWQFDLRSQSSLIQATKPRQKKLTLYKKNGMRINGISKKFKELQWIKIKRQEIIFVPVVDENYESWKHQKAL